MPANGLVVMPPTSISYSGTSAAINTDKSVSFSAVTSLSLNGVFTSSYDNYMITMRFVTSVGSGWIGSRLRVGGTDATGANYSTQRIFSDSSSVTSARETSQSSWIRFFYGSGEQRSGTTSYLFMPQQAVPTAFRSVNSSGYLNATLADSSGTHSLSTSYDGITIIPSGINMTGLLTVFGFND